MVERTKRGKLIVASNRLPVTVKRSQGKLRAERSSGGLVAAMEPAMQRQGGVWIGWPGTQLKAGETLEVEGATFDMDPIQLSPSETKRFYHGFSNGALWPLFHSLPERMQLDPRNWSTYETINQRFADAIVEQLEDDDLVWIHDYHLALCPELVRRARPDARIAFFLHIPFPPFDLFRILPTYHAVLRGLLASDLVGFHCPGYVANFEDCVERLLGVRVDRANGEIEHGDRVARVSDFPLGIDYARYEKAAREGPRPRRAPHEKIILGVDRLDYTKGIPERLRAYERMLELHSEMRGEVSFVQIAVPSREQVTEYQSLKREIDELVGRINGRFGRSDWTPIRYIHRSIDGAKLSALYRDAAVALVTPLRDGMNLVAKEFVASQTDDPGVLLLSRMAGAAETMREALRVNPYNVEGVAEALHRALVMPSDEREARMRALQRRERKHDLGEWLDLFIGRATAPRHSMRPVAKDDFESWLGAFSGTHPLAIFLDFDGTLAPIAPHPSLVKIGDGMREALADCSGRPDTDLAIVSGRGLADVRRMVDNDRFVYAGNHGLEIAGPGIETYRHPDIAHYERRAVELVSDLERIEADGAWVEAKGASLTFHFREVEAEEHEALAEKARAAIREAGFQARDALCAVEARPPIGWDKGHAVLHVLRTKYGPGWSESVRVIYVGDDETDEDAFRSLHGLGMTFRVGAATQPTRARRRLSDVRAVETMLQWIAGRPQGSTFDRAISPPAPEHPGT
ncbi:MAG: bifunctional alpha,alpha-trehalose-phosphate synthase (UDP-forming)/trehalose-phosphatase [bacterium]|nr:bifunctional alpha,alpha-trehalose-phosphate synthase (UDP-forming)/trehalose-phosphatase [bacterium]